MYVSSDFALLLAFNACLSLDCCFSAFMLSGATLGVSNAMLETFTIASDFFNGAVVFRDGMANFFAEADFLAGNDFREDVAFLPAVDALLIGAEALLVRLTFAAFSYDSSEPLQSESALSRLKSSSELLLLT